MLGRGVEIVTSGAPLARQVEHVLGTRGLDSPRSGEGGYGFLCTGDAEAFRAQGTRFLQLPLGEVEHGAAAASAAGGGGRVSAPRAQRRPRAGELRPVDDRARLRAHRDRLGADLLRRDARDLHGLGRRSPCRAGWRGKGRGWVTAEYGMLPASTGERKAARRHQGPRRRPHRRDPAADRPLAARRRRLRGARRAHDLHRLRRADGRRRHPLRVDHRRLRRARARAAPARRRRASSQASPLTGSVAAVSCGIVDGAPLLDLDYAEDSTAEVDANVVMTGDGGLRRGAGDGRAHAALARAPRRAARARPARDRGAARRAGRRRLRRPPCGWCSPPATTHKVRELARLLRRRRARAAAGRGRAAAGGDGRHVRRERARQGARGRRRDRARRDRRRLRRSRPRRSAARPGVRSRALRRRGTRPTPRTSRKLPRRGAGRQRAALRLRDRLRRPRTAPSARSRGVCEGTLAADARGDAAASATTRRSCPTTSPSGRTMAELTDAEKDAISHRGRAARALLAWLAA